MCKWLKQFVLIFAGCIFSFLSVLYTSRSVIMEAGWMWVRSQSLRRDFLHWFDTGGPGCQATGDTGAQCDQVRTSAGCSGRRERGERPGTSEPGWAGAGAGHWLRTRDIWWPCLLRVLAAWGPVRGHCSPPSAHPVLLGHPLHPPGCISVSPVSYRTSVRNHRTQPAPSGDRASEPRGHIPVVSTKTGTTRWVNSDQGSVEAAVCVL